LHAQTRIHDQTTGRKIQHVVALEARTTTRSDTGEENGDEAARRSE
jgi:hypothetical protein